MLLSLPLLFSLPSVSVCWGSPAGWPSVEFQSCSPAAPTAPPEALLTGLQLGPELRVMLVTHWSLCEGPEPRLVRLHSNHDAGLFHQSLCAVMVSHCPLFESHQSFYDGPELEVGCQLTPGELCGPGLLLIRG